MATPALKVESLLAELTGLVPPVEIRLRKIERELRDTLPKLQGSGSPAVLMSKTALGIAQALLGNEEAITSHRSVCTLSPSAQHFYNLGVTLNVFWRFREALEALQRAEEMDPKGPAILAAKAVCLHGLHDILGAQQHVQAAMDLIREETPGDLLHQVGNHLLKLGATETATKVFAWWLIRDQGVPPAAPLKVIEMAPEPARTMVMRKLLTTVTVGQMNANKERWHRFLEDVVPEHVVRAEELLDVIEARLRKNVPAPITTRQADGTLDLTWNFSGGCVELTLLPSGKLLWFFRVPEAFGGSNDDEALDSPPPEFFDRLRSVTEHS